MPLLDLLFTMLWIYLVFLWIRLVVTVFIDIFRSPDLSGWGKAGWKSVRFPADGLAEGLDPDSDTGRFVPNHNPGFYVIDEAMKTGVRAHAHVALDFLSGA